MALPFDRLRLLPVCPDHPVPRRRRHPQSAAIAAAGNY
jgi:hypothetical protein